VRGILARSGGEPSGAAFLGLVVDGTTVPVSYLGKLDAHVGDELSVTGEVGASGGIRADDIRPTSASARFDEFAADPWNAALALSWATAIAFGLLFAASIVLLVRRWGYSRALRRMAERAVVALILVSMLGLAGCTVDIHTTVREDGSGTLVTRMVPPDQATDISSLPNADAYLKDMQRRVAGAGTTFERDGSAFVFKRDFSSPAQLAGNTGAGGGYTNLTVQREGGETRYVFTARIDTRDLYKADGAMAADASNASTIKDELDKTEMTYTLELPGTVSYSNGSASGKSVSWRVPMNQTFDLRAESVVGRRAESPYTTAFGLWVGGIALVLVAALVILAVAIAWYPNPVPKAKAALS
jgi:hypothetical protein